jgi:hypothetical protein
MWIQNKTNKKKAKSIAENTKIKSFFFLQSSQVERAFEYLFYFLTLLFQI